MNRFVALLLLSTALLTHEPAPAHADEVLPPVQDSHSLLLQLQRFVEQRGIDVGLLTADAALGVMIDWQRAAPAAGGREADELVFLSGGWSEGCATGFKLSVLRRLPGAAGGAAPLTAGITLLFDTGANARFEPFRLASSELRSAEDFAAAIEQSPAFRKLAAETPMSAFIERGAMR
jgi:hypothetical protein